MIFHAPLQYLSVMEHYKKSFLVITENFSKKKNISYPLMCNFDTCNLVT